MTQISFASSADLLGPHSHYTREGPLLRWEDRRNFQKFRSIKGFLEWIRRAGGIGGEERDIFQTPEQALGPLGRHRHRS